MPRGRFFHYPDVEDVYGGAFDRGLNAFQQMARLKLQRDAESRQAQRDQMLDERNRLVMAAQEKRAQSQESREQKKESREQGSYVAKAIQEASQKFAEGDAKGAQAIFAAAGIKYRHEPADASMKPQAVTAPAQPEPIAEGPLDDPEFARARVTQQMGVPVHPRFGQLGVTPPQAEAAASAAGSEQANFRDLKTKWAGYESDVASYPERQQKFAEQQAAYENLGKHVIDVGGGEVPLDLNSLRYNRRKLAAGDWVQAVNKTGSLLTEADHLAAKITQAEILAGMDPQKAMDAFNRHRQEAAQAAERGKEFEERQRHNKAMEKMGGQRIYLSKEGEARKDTKLSLDEQKYKLSRERAAESKIQNLFKGKGYKDVVKLDRTLRDTADGLLQRNSALDKKAAFGFIKSAQTVGVITDADYERLYGSIDGAAGKLANELQQLVDGTLSEGRRKLLIDATAHAVKRAEANLSEIMASGDSMFAGTEDEEYWNESKRGYFSAAQNLLEKGASGQPTQRDRKILEWYKDPANEGDPDREKVGRALRARGMLK